MDSVGQLNNNSNATLTHFARNGLNTTDRLWHFDNKHSPQPRV